MATTALVSALRNNVMRGGCRVARQCGAATHAVRAASTVAAAADTYPTRGSSWDLLPRPDPTVWQQSFDAPGPLAPHQLEQFDRDGFLVLSDVFTGDSRGLFDEAKREADAHADKSYDEDTKVTESSYFVSEEGSGHLRTIFSIHRPEVTPAMSRILRSAPIVNMARQLLGDEVYFHQSRANFQTALHGKGFFWHSDFETWHAEDGMPIPRSLSCVILVDTNVASNGCLMVIPGSHKQFAACAGETPEANWEQSLKGQQEAGTPSLVQLRTLQERCEADRGLEHGRGIVHLEGGPTSVVIFDSNLMHGSHNNISPMRRCNLYAAFNAVSNVVQAPFSASTRRPEHLSTRASDAVPVVPME